MIATQVMMNYEKENSRETAQKKCTLMQNDSIYFFDTGQIEFKGVLIPTCEVVFDTNERYKENFSEEMVKLFSSIRENLWEQRIFQDLVDLLIKVVQTMPKFNITLPQSVTINNMQTIVNDSYVQLCRLAMKAYGMDEDYYQAIELLRNLIFISDLIPSFDRLVLDYLKGITEKYNILLDAFETHIDKEVDEKAAQIFHGAYYKTWLAAKNGYPVYKKMLAIGRKSRDITKKKTLWLSMISQNKEQLDFTLYSGKK
jgi:hypothetical protein